MATATHDTTQQDVRASLTLVGAALLALVLANSPLAGAYQQSLAFSFGFGIAGLELENTLKGWIKNALMAVFFLYVGLEIKAEFREGALADRRRATLPFAAAAGGLLVPRCFTWRWPAASRRPRAAGPSRRRPTSPSPWAWLACSARGSCRRR